MTAVIAQPCSLSTGPKSATGTRGAGLMTGTARPLATSSSAGAVTTAIVGCADDDPPIAPSPCPSGGRCPHLPAGMTTGRLLIGATLLTSRADASDGWPSGKVVSLYDA